MLWQSTLTCSANHNLQELPSLVKVELWALFHSSRAASAQQGPFMCLPQLPFGLCHLTLVGLQWHYFDCSWSGLQGCPKLQRLTLPSGVQVSGPLQEWISSARCLYVVDWLCNEDDESWTCRKRLPFLVE